MKRLVYLFLTTLVLGAAGCGSARRGVPVDPPMDVSEPELAHGEQVFMQFCNGCHPGGGPGLGLGINNKPLPGWAIRTQVRRGLGVMPDFSDDVIPDDDLNALVAYIKALRDHPD